MLSFIFMIVACALACNADQIRHGGSNRYFVFTRQNSRMPYEINADNINESIGALDINRNTIVIVHGYEGSATTSLNPLVKDAALTSEDLNVIVVDWNFFASITYTTAVEAVPSVGKYLADLIMELVNKKVLTLNRLHLIGFDLGAHIVGFTGRALEGKVARITGLNPSGNLWKTNSRRLNINDAQYVEVIHTDSIGLGSYGIGDSWSIGHVDIYANGGSSQPGCFSNICSHNRAWELMAASLTHNQLFGHSCQNWFENTLNTCRGMVLLIGNNNFFKYGSGIYRVNTVRTYPYA